MIRTKPNIIIDNLQLKDFKLYYKLENCMIYNCFSNIILNYTIKSTIADSEWKSDKNKLKNFS